MKRLIGPCGTLLALVLSGVVAAFVLASLIFGRLQEIWLRFKPTLTPHASHFKSRSPVIAESSSSVPPVVSEMPFSQHLRRGCSGCGVKDEENLQHEKIGPPPWFEWWAWGCAVGVMCQVPTPQTFITTPHGSKQT